MPAARAGLPWLDEIETRGIDTCTTCPTLCRWACPVAEAEARETTSPHRLVVLSGLLKKEKAPVEAVAHFPYHCSHCLACTEACLHKNDVPLLLSLARSRVLRGGAAPRAAGEVSGRFGVAGNAQGRSLEQDLGRAAEAAGAPIVREAASVYFPGCATIASMPEAVSSFLRAASLHGISDVAVTAASAWCCGLPLLWTGELEGFRAHAARLAAEFERTTTLVVHDPACAHALSVRYRQLGVHLSPEIKHVAAFLAERLGLEGGGSAGEPSARPKVAYADACTLARGLGIVGEPRRLLRRVLEENPAEIEGLVGREADCCGAGGLLPETAPSTARAMAEAKIQAFRASGADTLAMFSPRCAIHLRTVDPSVDVIDVATLLVKV